MNAQRHDKTGMPHQRSRLRAVGVAGALVLTMTTVFAPAIADETPTPSDSAPPGAAAPQYPVVASRLDNPRGLAVAPDGDIYVAESGHGGSGPCIASAEDPTVEACLGDTGAITRIRGGMATQVITGLPSLAVQVATQDGAAPPGAQAAGPSDVVVLDSGAVAFTVGLGTNPALRDETLVPGSPVAHLLGTLLTGTVPAEAGSVTKVADISAFEAADDPVPGPDGPDSNPNALLVDGSGYVVVDAGGNDLLAVDAAGVVTLMASFPAGTPCPPPPVPPEAVPTTVTRGPDGALYVGQLTGFPFCEGGASIYKVENGQATVYASGLTNVTGIDFAADGTLYAVEIAQQGLQKGPIGAVVAIPAGGGKSMADYQVVAAGLFAPYGIAIDGDSAYVTTGAILPAAAGGGNVIQIALAGGEVTAMPATPAASATSAPPASAGDTAPAATGGTSTWLWVSIGVLVLLVIVWFFVRQRRSGAQTTP